MGFREQAAADVAAFFMDFAESGTYRKKGGQDRKVLLVFESAQGPDKGTFVASDGESDRCRIWVKRAEVPNPERSDVIVLNGVEWEVQARSGGEMGLPWALDCVSGERPFGGVKGAWERR